MTSKLTPVMIRLNAVEMNRLNKFRTGPVGDVPAGAAVKYLMLKELERVEKAQEKKK